MESFKEVFRRIKINDIDWEIIEEDEGIHLGRDGSGFTVGSCDTLENKIYLYKNLETENKYRTLIHELTHAYLSSHGFKGMMFDEENICGFLEAYGRQIVESARLYIYQ